MLFRHARLYLFAVALLVPLSGVCTAWASQPKASVQTFQKLLNANKVRQAYPVLVQLCRTSPLPKGAVAAFAQAYSGKQYLLHRIALRCLLRAGQPGESTLQGLLRSHNKKLRERLISDLRYKGLPPKRWLPVFRELLASGQREMIQGVLKLLLGMTEHTGPALPELLTLTRSNDSKIRRDALWMTIYAGPRDARVLRAALRFLNHKDPKEVELGIRVLGKLGPKAQAPLLQLRRDPAKAAFHQVAVEALLKCCDAAAIVPYVVPLLAPKPAGTKEPYSRTLARTDRHVRYTKALKRFGPKAAPAVSALLRMVRSPVRRLRRAAIVTLGAIGPAAKPAIPALRKLYQKIYDLDLALPALHNIDPALTRRLIRSEFKQASAIRRQNLVAGIAALKARDDVLIGLALDAFGKISYTVVQSKVLGLIGRLKLTSPKAMATLAKALHMQYLQEKALEVCQQLGASARQHLPAIKQLASTGSPRAAQQALKVAVAFGVDASTLLMPMLGHQQWKVRYKAIQQLSKLGPKARKALPALRKLLRDAQFWVRQEAVEALGHLGAGAAVAAPELAKLLAAPEAWMRFQAARALGRIGSTASAVLPALQARLRDPKPWVAKAVAAAIKAMGATPHPKASAPKATQKTSPAKPKAKPKLPKQPPFALVHGMWRHCLASSQCPSHQHCRRGICWDAYPKTPQKGSLDPSSASLKPLPATSQKALKKLRQALQAGSKRRYGMSSLFNYRVPLKKPSNHLLYAHALKQSKGGLQRKILSSLAAWPRLSGWPCLGTRLLGYKKPLLKSLIQQLKSSDGISRFHAVLALFRGTPAALRSWVRPYLLYVIHNDPNEFIRAHALYSLTRRALLRCTSNPSFQKWRKLPPAERLKLIGPAWAPGFLKAPWFTRLKSDASPMVRRWAQAFAVNRTPTVPWVHFDVRDAYGKPAFWVREGRSHMGTTCRDHERYLAHKAGKRTSRFVQMMNYAPLCRDLVFKRCFLSCKSLSACSCKGSPRFERQRKAIKFCTAKFVHLARTYLPPKRNIPTDRYKQLAMRIQGQIMARITMGFTSIQRRCNRPPVAACVQRIHTLPAAFQCLRGFVMH